MKHQMTEEQRVAFIDEHGIAAYNTLMLQQGPGRPIHGERKTIRSVSLSDSDVELLQKIGAGNTSGGIRKLISLYKQNDLA